MIWMIVQLRACDYAYDYFETLERLQIWLYSSLMNNCLGVII